MANPGVGGSSRAKALWPLAAILVVALFLIWLAMTSESSVEETPDETGDDTTELAIANGSEQQQQAEFATTYIEARRIEPATGQE